MLCETCGWPDGPCQEKKRKSSFFYVYLGERFLESMTIPCFMRVQFNNMVLGRVMLAMSPEQDEYVFDVKKKYDKTHIFGPRYQRILKDFEMKSGDRVRIEWDHPIDAFFTIFLEGADGVPKQRVLEPHVFEESAKTVVFSKDLTLTAGQTGRMNHHVLTRGLGLGHVFVHTITVIDVAKNGLRIPKEIASVLDIPEKGKANLIFGYDWNSCEASYYTCKDERICFRAGWPEFAAQHKIGDGSVLLILFHKDNGYRLCVSFDRL